MRVIQIIMLKYKTVRPISTIIRLILPYRVWPSYWPQSIGGIWDGMSYCNRFGFRDRSCDAEGWYDGCLCLALLRKRSRINRSFTENVFRCNILEKNTVKLHSYFEFGADVHHQNGSYAKLLNTSFYKSTKPIIRIVSLNYKMYKSQVSMPPATDLCGYTQQTSVFPHSTAYIMVSIRFCQQRLYDKYVHLTSYAINMRPYHNH